MFENFNLANIIIMILPLLFAITVHEAAHAYMARHYGDRTAEQLGRLTLNPISHIDPVGTILVPVLMSLMPGGFIFGWAKPVPVISRNFRDVRMGMRMVSIAGPLSNLIMAVGWALLLVLSYKMNNTFSEPLSLMSTFGIQINIMLFVLNMLPILPLDGGRFVDTFLSARASMQFQKIEPYGTWIILGLLVTGILSKIMFPFMMLLMGLITSFVQILL